MNLRYLMRRIPWAGLLPALFCAAAAVSVRAADVRPADSPSIASSAAQDGRASNSAGIIHRIEFRGLRRIPAATLRTHISSKVGEPLDAQRIEEDVRALDRLGWFDSVSVEVEEIPVLLASADAFAAPLDPLLRLVFVVEERPFLASVEFRGSHALSREKLAAVVAGKGIALKLAAPVNRNDLWRAARAIEAALADDRHPLAKARVRLDEEPGTASVRVTLEIHDGPQVTVGAITFSGNQAFSQSKLEHQMKRVAPDALLAGLRGKDVYSSRRLDADLQRLADFYHNNGYPEARIGKPVAAIAGENVRHWLPWPHKRSEPRFHIAIPVHEGQLYRLSAVDVRRTDSGQRASGDAKVTPEEAGSLAARLNLRADEPFSQEKIARAREVLMHLRELRPGDAPSLAPDVAVVPQFDAASGTVRVRFDVGEARAYLVRRIEFRGEQRFSDKYYRKRVLLAEGEAFDPERLERGLAQLTRAGFIKPVRQEDIQAEFDETQHTVDLTIRVSEIGRQKISLVGGHSSLGNTIGLVYNVFDLLGGEELITSHLEGGPQSLQILLGVAKEGLFGTRFSMGLSLYENVVKPALASHQRLFTSSSSGWGTNWSYPLAPADTLSASYQLARTSTTYGALLPATLVGLPNPRITARTTSSAIGLSEAHENPQERILSSIAASGGWLGGSENLVRSKLDYARVFNTGEEAQPGRHSAWAFRGYLSGVTSFRGDMPANSRILAGDDLVRGAGMGELGPYALNKTQNADGTASYQTTPSGADVVAAVNTEYRVPVAPRTQAAAFFDAGSGWLLPNWLGPDKPMLAGANYNMAAATGVELKWMIPGIEQTIRMHYAINPFHIRRSLVVVDGSDAVPVLLPRRHRARLGWALGSLF